MTKGSKVYNRRDNCLYFLFKDRQFDRNEINWCMPLHRKQCIHQIINKINQNKFLFTDLAQSQDNILLQYNILNTRENIKIK